MQLMEAPMDGDEDVGNPFAITNLWKPSRFAQLGLSPVIHGLEVLELENDTKDIYAPSNYIDLYLPDFKSFEFGSLESLPDLKSFEFGSLESLHAIESSTASSSVDALNVWSIDADDIWTFPQDSKCQHTRRRVRTWETFYDPTFKEPCTAYISEAGPSAFDAALVAASVDGALPLSRVVQSDPSLSSLFQLGLGRESLLFKYVDEMSFRPCLEDGRMSGCTLASFQSLSAKFFEYGNTTRRLQSFIDETYNSKNSFPTLIALGDAVRTIRAALQSQIISSSLSIRSLIQLQARFHRPGQILVCLSAIIDKTRAATCNNDLLSKIYDYVLELEDSDNWLRPIVLSLLAHVSKTWLDSMAIRLGLQTNNSIIIGDERKEEQEVGHIFGSPVMPNFIPEEDAKVMVETWTSLQLLQVYKPYHPLAMPPRLKNVKQPVLDWHFSWVDAERIQAQVIEYETAILCAIKEFDRNGFHRETLGEGVEGLQHGNTEKSGETPQAQIVALFTRIEEPIDSGGDDLSKALEFAISMDSSPRNDLATFEPPLSLVPLLSFSPILSTQARLVNQACLRLFFKDHSIRSHLSLQYRYSLFGDGVFASRLSHALFDPELETAERHKGHSRSGLSGLKLGSRDNWPPASSEVRLALMGILTECFNAHTNGLNTTRGELPGGLSFAIRDISDDEFQRCIDPNSIEALDFLRLQYKPLSPLQVVITPSCLDKYDILFKLLLRGLRMLYVVNQLLRDDTHRSSRGRGPDLASQRFRIEAHHFVSTVCGYFSDGVRTNWDIFEHKLDEIEMHLDDRLEYEGLHRLREYHETVLDRMMFALLLRKRQAQVKKLLEEIFSSVLHFAKHSREKALEKKTSPKPDIQVQEMYRNFRKKVCVFVSVCRSLGEKRGYGGTTKNDHDDSHDLFARSDMNEDGGNTIGHLALRLEMSGYYSTSRAV